MRIGPLSIQRGWFWPKRDPRAWSAPAAIDLDANIVMFQNIDGRCIAGTESGSLWEIHSLFGYLWAWRFATDPKRALSVAGGQETPTP